MTVKELKKALENLPDNCLIMIPLNDLEDENIANDFDRWTDYFKLWQTDLLVSQFCPILKEEYVERQINDSLFDDTCL